MWTTYALVNVYPNQSEESMIPAVEQNSYRKVHSNYPVQSLALPDGEGFGVWKQWFLFYWELKGIQMKMPFVSVKKKLVGTKNIQIY